ncbi:carbohydrate-binding protein [Cellvibrio sp. ARAG 10.3]|uniref:carbohydrate-binding protein n=1 Tax=Cellvibrio sp. ARAG 10.3 TaxID=3451358 RepID=UPI003F44A9FA
MKIKRVYLFMLALLFSAYVNAQDQCDFTSQCKNIYGSPATDCAQSRTDNSICMCGSLRCDQYGVPSINYTRVPGRIQAEDYEEFYDATPGNQGGQYKSDDVDIQSTNDAGGGFNVGWIDAGEWLEFPIDITEAGNYQIQFRVASLNGSGTISMDIDGSSFNATVDVPNTGNWQQWQTVTSVHKNFSVGKRILRLTALEGGFNLNWIDIQKADGGTTPPGNTNTMLGKFNINKDLLLAHFDQKPDLDDVHAVAALATMLRDQRFRTIKYHAVAGTTGTQGGRYIDAPHLFNLAFGANWSNASTNWNSAVNTVAQKALATLNSGGHVWVQEAGQSDFTADVVRLIKQTNGSINLKNQFHVVQHSNWNEDKTTPADLNYVKTTVQYNKIADGNAMNNGTPGFNTKDGSDWVRAKSNQTVGAIWSEAQRVANANNSSSGYENPSIKAGGFDFSDCVENVWIFGFLQVNNVKGFFNEFLSSPTTSTPPNNSSDALAFTEQNGLLVVELESTSYSNSWLLESGNGSFNGNFLTWKGNDSFGTPGMGTISIPVKINNPGRYKFNMRSIIRHGTSTTEANDSWLKINADKFYGFKNGHIVCPRNTVAESCNGDVPKGSSSNGWFKVYRSGSPANSFLWSALTSDNDGHNIFAEFNQAGTYSLEISARSKNHGIDRIVLHRDGNNENNVLSAYATSSERPESQLQ